MRIVDAEYRSLSWILQGFLEMNKMGGYMRVAYEECVRLAETSDLPPEQKEALKAELKQYFSNSQKPPELA